MNDINNMLGELEDYIQRMEYNVTSLTKECEEKVFMLNIYKKKSADLLVENERLNALLQEKV